MIPRLITSLKAPAPSLSLVVEENFTDELTVSLRCGELDAAIMSLPFQSQGLISRPLYAEPFKVALPGDHPLAKKSASMPLNWRIGRCCCSPPGTAFAIK